MTTPTCATCRFFGGGNRCHRSPPVWIAAGDHVQPGWWQPTTDAGGWCGEHTPAEPVGVPVLPEGWEWHDATDGTAAVCSARPDRYVFLFPIGLLDAFSAPPDVVLAAIAAHRARGVR